MNDFGPLIILSVLLLPLIFIFKLSKLKRKHADALNKQDASQIESNKRFYAVVRKISSAVVSISAAFFGYVFLLAPSWVGEGPGQVSEHTMALVMVLVLFGQLYIVIWIFILRSFWNIRRLMLDQDQK